MLGNGTGCLKNLLRKKSRKNLRRKKTPQSACLSRKGCVFFLKETKCKTRERKGCVFFFSEESRNFCS